VFAKALIKTAEQHGNSLRILSAVDGVNEMQKTIILKKLASHFKNRLKGRTIAIWGLSFKPQTDDIRDAPSLAIITRLLAMGVKVKAHDPIAIPPVKALFGGKVSFYETGYDALRDVDALLIVTEWNEFRRPDFARMRKSMRHPVIFDGRNIYDPQEMKGLGFHYYGIGR
jgi:UDPglucose 6-dehydrogenase